MSYALPAHIALVDTTGQISPTELASVAGALNEQVRDDFAPIWHVRATVGAYTAATAPANTWRVEIDARMDEPGALGYHADSNRVPYARVLHEDGWTKAASHEVCEMLADPFGSRMHAARLPQGIDPAQVGYDHAAKRVHYLLEVCDPPEQTSYEVGGVAVSDFLLPVWYHTNPPIHLEYSFRGACTQPRQVAQGGYVSFMTEDSTWWQVTNWGALKLSDLGKFDASRFGSLREFTDAHARSAKVAS